MELGVGASRCRCCKCLKLVAGSLPGTVDWPHQTLTAVLGLALVCARSVSVLRMLESLVVSTIPPF